MPTRSIYEIKYGRKLFPRHYCEQWRWAATPITRRWFFAAYAEDLQFTPPHESASLVARGETTFHAGVTDRAWVWRSYVFHQRPEGETGPANDIEPRFYGFVHFWENPFLTQQGEENQNGLTLEEGDQDDLPALGPVGLIGPGEVAEAYLAPPERLLRPHYYVLQVPATAFYGVLSTSVTPICMPRVYAFGLCAQCVAHSALVLASGFGAIPLSLLDLTWVGLNCEVAVDPTLVELRGLNLHEIARAIGNRSFTHCGVAHEAVQLPLNAADSDEWPQWRAMIGNLICDLLASGLPVVAMVSSEEWFELAYPHRKVSQVLGIQVEAYQNHTVLLVGFHSPHEGDNHVRLICHDPAVGPFVEVTLEALVHSAFLYNLNNRDPNETHSRLAFVTPRPSGAVGPLTAARADYITKWGLPATTSDLRLRFFHHSDFYQVYQRQLAWGHWNGDAKREFIKIVRAKWNRANYFIGVEDLRSDNKRVYLYDASGDHHQIWGAIDKDSVSILDEDGKEVVKWPLPPTSSLKSVS